MAARIREIVRRTWGHDRLRPLQEEAIVAGIQGRDSLVVLPTGGGKSLCYQVPPLLAGRTDVVVSPLISLMKDQVDALSACGYPATALHSGLNPAARIQAERLLASGECRLVFVAPERLFSEGFLAWLDRLSVRAFAIDEAHCISHWGHDFRPEYRRLAILKERFPGAGIHAYTATATEPVRRDIVEQLRLEDPAVLVGRFDRPNLVYRIVPRRRLRPQVEDVLSRHEGEAVIVYCLSRLDTERLAAHLRKRGHRAACYHAGMDAAARRAAQDAFSREERDVIVATVAFGMGIDRSDVRCVIHAAMPKTIEHYQQETGRAGRDGLEAECVLLHSPADVLRWRSLIEKSSEGLDGASPLKAAAESHLERMRRFCSPGRCRHKMLSEHFGQAYEGADCGACDVCLGECEELEDGTVRAQMILSCVARTGQRFGAGYVVDVLRGAENDRILARGHQDLSTFGLLEGTPRKALMAQIYQLLDQDLLTRTSGDYPVLELNGASREILRGERRVWFVPAPQRKERVKKTPFARDSWEGVDRALFERLRALRTAVARERGVPPYVIFSDAALRDMARRRPRDPQAFLEVHGVGEKKLEDLGERFLACIARFSESLGVSAGRGPSATEGSSAARDPRSRP